jgi:hypothetical protein
MLLLVADSDKAESSCSRANVMAIHDLQGCQTMNRGYLAAMLVLSHAKGVIVLSEPMLRDNILNSLVDVDVGLWSQRYYLGRC